MRSTICCLTFLPLLALPRLAHADAMDSFSIVGNGYTVDFALPAATTGSDAFFSGDQFLVSAAGTVNGISSEVGLNFVFGVGCSACQTIITYLYADAAYLYLELPPLYNITSPTSDSETFTFIPGTYVTNQEYPILVPDPTYTITITPEAAAATPEPSSLLLLASGAFLSLLAFATRGCGLPLRRTAHAD